MARIKYLVPQFEDNKVPSSIVLDAHLFLSAEQ